MDRNEFNEWEMLNGGNAKKEVKFSLLFLHLN